MFARLLFIILGTVCLFVGLLGVVLPLLPATPFLLLASACYVRGSQTLHRWLMSRTYVGTYITNIQEHRGMPRKAKIMTLVVLWGSLLFSLCRVDSLLAAVPYYSGAGCGHSLQRGHRLLGSRLLGIAEDRIQDEDH